MRSWDQLHFAICQQFLQSASRPPCLPARLTTLAKLSFHRQLPAPKRQQTECDKITAP